MIYVIIIYSLILGFLGFKLYQKKRLDEYELEHYKQEVEEAKTNLNLTKVECNKYEERRRKAMDEYLKALSDFETTKEKREYEEYKLEECKKDLQAALDVYQDVADNKLKEIDASMEEQRQKRQADLDAQFEERKTSLDLRMRQLTSQAQERVNKADEKAREQIEELEKRKLEAIKDTNNQIEKFESILEVLRKYDLEQQAKLYYTIQLPEEFHDDIEFLLTTVAAKVQHPDIISKLVWQEYVKPNLEETFKRIEIKNEPGIYKLTSLQNGKCYIGKSTDVKRRLTDHFKSAIGLTTISDQLVHHAIRKEGFWNWTIEIITYCDKEKLGELEKYYIEFFKTQEFGYNKRAGG